TCALPIWELAPAVGPCKIRVCRFLAADDADVAQLVEQPICNRQVPGSSPGVSSSVRGGGMPGGSGGVAEWLMAADCKSAGLTPYVGSNPTPTTGGRTVGPSDSRAAGCGEQAWGAPRGRPRSCGPTARPFDDPRA